MSQKINETAKMIYDAYGVDISHLDVISEKLADICALAGKGEEPSGFVAKKVQETFSKDDLEIIATMFLIKVINEENEKQICQCPECKAKRGEFEEDSFKEFISKEFPGMKDMVVKVPKEKNDKTNC